MDKDCNQPFHFFTLQKIGIQGFPEPEIKLKKIQVLFHDIFNQDQNSSPIPGFLEFQNQLGIL